MIVTVFGTAWGSLILSVKCEISLQEEEYETGMEET